MSVKNQKLKQVSKGAANQFKPYSKGKNSPKYTIKLNLEGIGDKQHLQVIRDKSFQAKGYKRDLQIKPLAPQYPDSLFKSKDDYDAMIGSVIEDAKSGRAIIRNKSLEQESD